ncbi:4'-phosphopantetheinyl transferase superfamily protein [Streptomyces sp. S.PB5]|uniref:4'-phosphopantetheinyl transferase family protein n=1 Tax=Streptomyces sp. S.PB5 TaxID=3020844 RepID=UPI0025B016FB|nr:4'-phosphopantetheinyl transferase superfamily protein [Streptomyces sp. S.PB5]MDN3028242.1 4'-phosphopantetheinyl transferase superfamily protein [Streptomyces sp. S.PB5]
MSGSAYQSLREGRSCHVWQGKAPDHVADRDLDELSAEELQAARRLTGPHSAAYAAVHVALRRILAHYLEVPPRELVFGRATNPGCGHPGHGRPQLAHPRTGLEFSLSRTGPHWLIAVEADATVGVDIEDMSDFDHGAVSSLVLSPSERAHLRACSPGPARTRAFYHCWTRKEAVVKASGAGITSDLSAVEVHPGSAGPVPVRQVTPRGTSSLSVRDLDVGPHLCAALAREEGGTGPVLMRRYSLLDLASTGGQP